MPYTEPEDFRPEQRLEPKVTEPIGWEDGTLPWHRRLGRTLGATFAPFASLHGVVHGDVGPALRFALVTCLPAMLLWAIPPYTHTLMFGIGFDVSLVPTPHELPIELDVVRAMAIGLVYSLLEQLSWCVPFVSLLAGFSDGSRKVDPKRAGWRASLYRMWVVPLGMLLYFAIQWALPIMPDENMVYLLDQLTRTLPRLMIFVHCHVMARYFGASGFGAFVVSGVPQLVRLAAGLLLGDAALRLLPVPLP